MPDFEKMYFALTAKVGDAVEMLIKAQLEGEESYSEDAPDADDAESKSV